MPSDRVAKYNSCLRSRRTVTMLVTALQSAEVEMVTPFRRVAKHCLAAD